MTRTSFLHNLQIPHAQQISLKILWEIRVIGFWYRVQISGISHRSLALKQITHTKLRQEFHQQAGINIQIPMNLREALDHHPTCFLDDAVALRNRRRCLPQMLLLAHWWLLLRGYSVQKSSSNHKQNQYHQSERQSITDFANGQQFFSHWIQIRLSSI